MRSNRANNSIRMLPSEQTAPCAVRQELAEAIQRSHQQAMLLGEQEVKAVINGDLQALAEIETQLADAKDARHAAMSAFKQHLAEHDCA